MYTDKKCTICGSQAKYYDLYRIAICDCKTCGSYILEDDALHPIDKDILASYLFYKYYSLLPNKENNIIFFYGSNATFEIIHKKYPNSQFIKKEELENWYPKNISERANYILSHLANYSDYPGKEIYLEEEQIKSLFFINRYSNGKNLSLEECNKQIDYMSNYMLSQNLLKKEISLITILPEGWRRIAELPKNNTNSKQAFIAMSFKEEMKDVQNAIEKAIIAAGYIPRVMNKIEHNNQIVPEILYQIKQSKFVVAEFSTNNNGAYYEAGYAAGLGREVIHICNYNKFHRKGHFDIKQKSTILWKTVDEISDALFKRIEATIGKSK
jgi:nucleoside 2-deoxyribosyltransferase